jgi:mono/diheme cytochrome c family protein
MISFIACVTQPKLQYYNFPEDITEEAKIANLKMLEKGRVLYNINCAKCHNKKIKGKIIIPDFTNTQLESYTIRIQNEVHVNNLQENKLTSEELEAIQFFFSYKKPGQPVVGQ